MGDEDSFRKSHVFFHVILVGCFLLRFAGFLRCQGPAQAGGGLEEAASWKHFLGEIFVDDEMAGFSWKGT